MLIGPYGLMLCTCSYAISCAIALRLVYTTRHKTAQKRRRRRKRTSFGRSGAAQRRNGNKLILFSTLAPTLRRLFSLVL